LLLLVLLLLLLFVSHELWAAGGTAQAADGPLRDFAGDGGGDGFHLPAADVLLEFLLGALEPAASSGSEPSSLCGLAFDPGTPCKRKTCFALECDLCGRSSD